MKRLSIAKLLTIGLGVTAGAEAAVTNDAASVSVQTSCTVEGIEVDNCFDNIAALGTWINGTRRPGVDTPLAVTLGPGRFTGPLNLTCDAASGYTGNMSFTGSGTMQSILVGATFVSPLNVSGCSEIDFSSLTIHGPSYGGITWSGGGNSNWTDVSVIGTARAWYEPTCGATRGQHYWFSSQVKATAAFTLGATYLATCDESWFFGSEVVIEAPAGSPGTGGAVIAGGDGIIHLYGSVLRGLIDEHRTTSDDVIQTPVARTGQVPYNHLIPVGGEIHIHGTGIDVLSATGQDVIALYADGGMIHANSSAFNMQSTGTRTRVRTEGGTISAPFQWKQAAEAPDIVSETGADTAIVTNTSDNHPHMVIYDASCASRWYDIVTAQCR